MLTQEVFETLRLDLRILPIVKVLADISLPIDAVVLVEPSHHLISSGHKFLQKRHLHSKPRIDIRRVFREQTLHCRVKLVETPLAL